MKYDAFYRLLKNTLRLDKSEKVCYNVIMTIPIGIVDNNKTKEERAYGRESKF